MIAFLLGVPSKLKTLTDRLTSTRATNLDNLDAQVSTRAAASTALSTATWTSGRAAKLDSVALNTDPLLKAPKANGLALISSEFYTNADTIRQVNVTLDTLSTSYTTVLNYTGSGFLDMCMVHPVSGSSNTSDIFLKITIDGVVVAEGSVSANDSATPRTILVACGTVFGDGRWAGGKIPFYTSLLIETKVSNNHFGVYTIRVGASVVKTS
jgi:hypothetical protein